MSERKLVSIVVAAFTATTLMTACSGPTPATPISGPSAAPTAFALTLQIPNIVLPTTTTEAPAGQSTEAPASTPFDMGGLIKGTPVAQWNGINVMPGAIAGGENSGMYAFTTSATAADVAAFYVTEMQKLGFEGSPTNATPGLGSIYTMLYHKGTEQAMITILPQPGSTVVMISR